MFCNACGRPNPDGSYFCSSCGKALNRVSPPPVQQENTNPQYTSAPYNRAASTGSTEKKPPKQAFEEVFRRSWRELAVSPLALVLIITHSISVLFSVIELQSMFSDLGELSDILSIFGGDLFEDLDSSLTILLLLFSAPGILTAVALWLLYADAHDLSATRPIKTVAFSILKGVMIGIIVIFYFCIAAVLFTSCSAMGEMDLYSSSARGATSTLIFILLIVAVVCGIYYRFAWNLLNAVKYSADFCFIDTTYIKGFSVVMYISGGLSVVGMIATGITLNMLVSCAVPFMFGAMLGKYNELMERLILQHRSIFGRPNSIFQSRQE